jgi:predicted exporter
VSISDSAPASPIDRFSRLPIAIWLCFLIICGAIISRSTFTTDLSAFLPRSPTAQQQLLLDQIRDGVASRIILVDIEAEDSAKRARLSKQLAQKLRLDNTFASVQNGEPVTTEKDRAYLFNHRYLLSPAISSEHFEVASLRAALIDSIDMLASPAGMMVKSLLPHDPTGEMLYLLNQFNSDKQPAKSDGVWTSRDGKRAVLLVQTRASGANTDAQQNAINTISQSFKSIETSTTVTPEVKIRMTGPGVFGVKARETIQEEVSWLSVLSILLIAALLLAVYRSVLALVLGFLPVISGALAGVTAVSLGFGSVHGITLGFGTALIGEAVDYSIYLFVQSRQGAGNQAYWLKRFWPTIRLGVLTSIIGFASLLWSGFPGLAQLGLYSIAGLITAALVTRFVLPQMLPTWFHIHDVSILGNRLVAAVRRAHILRWPALIALIIATFILIQKREHLWNDKISSLSPISQADIQHDADLRLDTGAPDVRYMVIVNGASREEVLQTSEHVSDLLQAQLNEGLLAGFESPSKYLPSLASQLRRQTSLPMPDVLQQRLIEASQGLPVKPTLFTPFLQDIAAAKTQALLQAVDLRNTSMQIALDALLIQHGQQWSALLPLTASPDKRIDAQRLRIALATLKTTHQSQALLVDMKQESDNLYAGYLKEAVTLSLGGLLAMIGLLMGVTRSAARVFHLMAPLAAAVIIVTAGLAVFGQQLIILHLIGLLLVVAVGSNYTLFFDASQQEAISPSTLTSMLFANMTTVAGFGLLAFSKVSLLQAMGVTVAPGVVLALLFAAIFAPKQTISAANIVAKPVMPKQND